MIPLLLWRCPLCAADDALQHVERRFRAGRLRCLRCRAEWRVRRVPGDDFYLRLARPGERGRPQPRAGDERALAEWYQAMKATVRLESMPEASWPAGTLEPGEALYLASGPAELWAEESDPLFFPDAQSMAGTRVDKSRVQARPVGRGRLFLTGRRLAWHGDGRGQAFPLARLNSAHAFLDAGLLLMVEMRLYTVRFAAESVLKWVTYLALIAPRVEAETGHRIATSHY